MDDFEDEIVEEEVTASVAAAVYIINSSLNLKRKAEVSSMLIKSFVSVLCQSLACFKVNQAVEDFVGMKVMLHEIEGEDKEVD